MGALNELGLNTTGGDIMCVSAPDSVLAEAGAMRPRPSFASTLLTAEPTARLLWWPERQHLEPQTLGRLRWLIETAAGQAWLVLDEREEESPSVTETELALGRADMAVAGRTRVGHSEVALQVALPSPD